MKRINDLESYLTKVSVDTKVPVSIFSDQEASSLKIHAFLVNAFGEDWWENEFETIEQILKRKYGVELRDSNREKVHALKTLSESDHPFIDWYEFNIIALSLNGSIVDFEYLVYPEPGQVISTVKIMNKLRPDMGGQFGKEVIKYITMILIFNGIYTPPPSLVDVVSKEMSQHVSQESANMWADVMKDTFEIIRNPDNPPPIQISPEKEKVGVQAGRVARSELAANVYLN